MKFKMSQEHIAELNELAEEHLGALVALHLDSYQMGLKSGRNATLLFTGVGIMGGAIALCIVGINHLERKRFS